MVCPTLVLTFLVLNVASRAKIAARWMDYFSFKFTDGVGSKLLNKTEKIALLISVEFVVRNPVMGMPGPTSGALQMGSAQGQCHLGRHRV